MEENDSTTSAPTSATASVSIPERKKLSYISLLQEIETLLKLSTKLNIPPHQVQETSDISEMETIFEHVHEDIDSITTKMSFQKKSMVRVMVLNTIIRVVANDRSSFIICRDSFQSMYYEIIRGILEIWEHEDYSPTCASDLLESVLVNLVKDDFAQICFKRLLSNETVLPVGNTLHNSRYRAVDAPSYFTFLWAQTRKVFLGWSVYRSVSLS